MNYYNENEPYCGEWLRNLIRARLIPDGHVDERDIRDVKPHDLRGYTQCHFFAGLGGWSRALSLAAWPADRAVWTGSCPCQPFSAAGKRGGFADERHLWPSWHYLISVCRPAIVFGEQVARATDWLRLVRGDLEALDYAVGAMPIEAASAGADQLRDRFWFVADRAEQSQRESQHANGAVARADAGGIMCINLGGGGGAGLAFGSVAEDLRGDVRKEGTAAGAAGDRGADVGSANRAGWDAGQFAAAPARHRNSIEPTSGALSERERERVRGERPESAAGTTRGMQGAGEEREWVWPDAGTIRPPEYEWVVGADGKARRVKPGIRLLAHDVPARVAKLRALGNAIVPQAAAEFIKAACPPTAG